jgi:hypothetical protein
MHSELGITSGKVKKIFSIKRHVERGLEWIRKRAS